MSTHQSTHYYGNPHSSEEPRPPGAFLNFKSACESELKETDGQKEKTIPGPPGKKKKTKKRKEKKRLFLLTDP